MGDGDDLDRLRGAYTERFKFHDENLWMLSWYADRMVDCLKRAKAESLISLGIGHRVVSQAILDALLPQLRRYLVVEGSAQAVREFTEGQSLPPQVQVVNGYFEDFTAPEPVDAIEMGFVLEHVEDPGLVLRRFAGFVRPGGTIVIVVPNARSLHRLVGQRAGLLDSVHLLSPQDLELGHRRYFDLASLTQLVVESGLRIVKQEGVYLKCLTTDQLRSLGLAPSVVQAFFALGVDYPDIANAIYLEATP
jgi:SAM-dependent methyltransferase